MTSMAHRAAVRRWQILNPDKQAAYSRTWEKLNPAQAQARKNAWWKTAKGKAAVARRGDYLKTWRTNRRSAAQLAITLQAFS